MSIIYMIQKTDSVAPAMPELRGMQITPSMPSLPGPLCSGVVAPDRNLSMGQIEQNFTHAKLNCFQWPCFDI